MLFLCDVETEVEVAAALRAAVDRANMHLEERSAAAVRDVTAQVTLRSSSLKRSPSHEAGKPGTARWLAKSGVAMPRAAAEAGVAPRGRAGGRSTW